MKDKNMPVKDSKRDIEKSERETFLPISPFTMFNNPVISFQYSKQVVSFFEDTTRIYSENHKYENGKLESESFKGTFSGNPFAESIELFQKQIMNQVAMMMKGFRSFLGSDLY